MAQLYLKIFFGEKNGKKFLAACISEKLHEFGIRMVADVLEFNG